MHARDYKQFAPNEFYHIYNRGVGKMNIFLDDEDYNFFLTRLKENLFPSSISMSNKIRRKLLPAGSFDLVCYCLMPNHFHLLFFQKTEVSISALMLKVMTGYVIYFNKKYDRVGSLFQDQFKAVCVKSDEQLLWLSAYIHTNPSVAQLVSDDMQYAWSSLREYITKDRGMCVTDHILQSYRSPAYYKKLMMEAKKVIYGNKKDKASTSALGAVFDL
ncbi:MAG: hypothetical protein COV34_01100 [Candidatus Zambryskibacteria bacterium CG10_big_fil_rev_8_21_14_0_10_42_12]|uniref:Transposase IS200-like domain-containing protein n=1 Tax=Candidatus Zambryskibacteria bacterium CG10_big_fil_rev_8_21_14_0_10_42_12 TaxID=1975115 RepID=A0A2H0QV92_9BACT|nr:MAG: hypothetical protein COV34_01100 [Candidatus Zambryskibacteria bacterium CG10_big_fil_rev_8_21_14_0_10_42_12]